MDNDKEFSLSFSPLRIIFAYFHVENVGVRVMKQIRDVNE